MEKKRANGHGTIEKILDTAVKYFKKENNLFCYRDLRIDYDGTIYNGITGECFCTLTGVIKVKLF